MTRRLLTLSAFAAGLFAVAAVAQPPAVTTGDAKKAGAKKADAPDAVIEAALANDPDVRMARAKMQLAEAEWLKARQAVTQKVLTLRSLIAEQKKTVGTVEESFALLREAHTRGQASRAEMLASREKLEAAQSTLARSEMELKLITGGAGVPAAHGVLTCPAAMKGAANCTACHTAQVGLERLALDVSYSTRLDTAMAVLSLRGAKATGGPVPERIRAALDKPVKLGAKGEKVAFDKALEVFKTAGLDVPVRNAVKLATSVTSQGEELPVGAWLQMFADEAPDCLILVREYGLLVTGKSLNPPTDAVTVFELWKQILTEPKK